MTHPYFADRGRPRIFAHRGFVSPQAASQGIVENSRAAFEAALAEGADYIESDCRLTSDGQVVLFHDDDLSRVLGDPRSTDTVDSAELARLMEPRGGLMGLEEALETFPGARFNIDIKTAAVAEEAGRIIGRHADRALVTSFSDRHRLTALLAATRVSGSAVPATSGGQRSIERIVIASLLRSRALARRSLRGLDALQIPETHGKIRVLTPRLLREAHGNGVEVHVWTVNDPADMRRLVELGVDGIVTDRADLAVAALRQ